MKNQVTEPYVGLSAGNDRQTIVTGISPTAARVALLLVAGIFVVLGFMVTDQGAVTSAIQEAGPDLTRLTRFMMTTKLAAALCAGGVVYWRLGAPIHLLRLALYTIPIAMMAFGPGLIWNMVYIAPGAGMIVGGIIMTVLLLWRDKAVGQRLDILIKARRDV